MSNLCIIPARGGSKRIPRKNIKEFLGKPIIAYSIEAAIKSNLFDEVMVSTDDGEISEIAIQFGAKVPFMRSEKNANDFATTYEVIEEVIEDYNLKNVKFDSLCCLYPCAPFVSSDKLKTAFEKLARFDTVIPIVEFGFPIQRAFEKGENDKLALIHPEHELSRSQDLRPRYHDAGQFYWERVNAILSEQKIFCKNLGSVVLSELEVQDIDNEIDWRLAELKYKLLHCVS